METWPDLSMPSSAIEGIREEGGTKKGSRWLQVTLTPSTDPSTQLVPRWQTLKMEDPPHFTTQEAGHQQSGRPKGSTPRPQNWSQSHQIWGPEVASLAAEEQPQPDLQRAGDSDQAPLGKTKTAAGHPKSRPDLDSGRRPSLVDLRKNSARSSIPASRSDDAEDSSAVSADGQAPPRLGDTRTHTTHPRTREGAPRRHHQPHDRSRRHPLATAGGGEEEEEGSGC
jgi:hypothetical protein